MNFYQHLMSTRIKVCAVTFVHQSELAAGCHKDRVQVRYGAGCHDVSTDSLKNATQSRLITMSQKTRQSQLFISQ